MSTGGSSTGRGTPAPASDDTRRTWSRVRPRPLTERCAAALGICLCEGGTPPGGMGEGGRSAPLGELCSGGADEKPTPPTCSPTAVGRRLRPRLLRGRHCHERSVTLQAYVSVHSLRAPQQLPRPGKACPDSYVWWVSDGKAGLTPQWTHFFDFNPCVLLLLLQVNR